MKTAPSTHIVFNTPSNINLNILFPTFKRDLDKVAFLINQINHFSSTGGYTVNVRNHDWLFGHKGLTSSIIKTLVTNDIIIPVGYYSAGNISTKFKIVNPYKVAPENDNKNIYDSLYFEKNDTSFPKFIQKWLADDYTVKNASTSSYLKTKEVDQDSNKALQLQIQQLLKENENLKLQLEQLQNEKETIAIESIQNELLHEAEMIVTGSTINHLNQLNDEDVKEIVTPQIDLELICNALEDFYDYPKKDKNKFIFDNFCIFQKDKKIFFEGDHLTKAFVLKQIISFTGIINFSMEFVELISSSKLK